VPSLSIPRPSLSDTMPLLDSAVAVDSFAAAEQPKTFKTHQRPFVRTLHGHDAGPLGLAAKMANSIDRSNTLNKTYAPVDIEAVRSADAARLKGRQRMRAENESGAKVSKKQPTRVSNGNRTDH
jgi:hypothetical protein